MAYDLAAALLSLRPGAQWALTGDDYVGLDWRDSSPAPSRAECEAEMARLKKLYDDQNYARQRRAEYPKIEDQLDTLFHGGFDAWHTQIAAIKAKYPKPDNS
jgi:hypothetical protein